ncbi:hypothetical protein GIB67_009953, partial [Kingdonia uniflora]
TTNGLYQYEPNRSKKNLVSGGWEEACAANNWGIDKWLSFWASVDEMVTTHSMCWRSMWQTRERSKMPTHGRSRHFRVSISSYFRFTNTII